MSHGVSYVDPINKPLTPNLSTVQLQPSSYYVFYYAGGTTPATVYSAGDLSVAYPSNVVTADNTGAFAAIFLDPSKVYRVQWFDQFNRRLMDVDNYISNLTVFGSNAQLAVNISSGNTTITPVSPGISGVALTVFSKPNGLALDTGINGLTPGVAEVQLVNTGATGATTGTFTATNKPGVANGGVTQWMPININGSLFYMPLWS